MTTRPPFIQAGYYTPMVLANGEDFCLLDCSGTMGFKEHIKAYYSYWFKKGRPNVQDPLGIVKLKYAFISDKGPVEPGAFDQQWFCREGRLVTRLEFFQLRLEIEVFLTADHTLVERFRVLDCTARNGVLRLDQAFPAVTYTYKLVNSLGRIPGAVHVSAAGGKARFAYRYRGDGGQFHGGGVTGFRVLQGTAKLGEIEVGNAPVEPITLLPVGGLKRGTELLRVTTVMDNLNTPHWKTEAEKINARYLRQPLARTATAHRAEWKTYFARSDFACDQPAIAQGFEVSAATARMALHPNGSVVSALALPNNHGMGTYWDAWFLHAGLLRTNHVCEARQMVEFWRSAYPLARRLAQEEGFRGARYPWVLRWDRQPWAHYPQHDLQIHNNAIPVVAIWEQCRYTGDRALLEESYPLLEDCVRFLVECALRRDKRNRWFLRPLQAVDESAQKKRDELTALVATLRGIEILRAAGQWLQQSPAPDLLAAEEPLRRILRRLKVGGAYRSYEGAAHANVATALAYIHLPHLDAFRRSIDAALAGSREPYGLGAGATSRMRCATFPWMEGMFAWAMAIHRDGRGFDRLEGMRRYVNFFGGFPEYHWLHGEPSRDWFVGAAGVFLAALVDLCFLKEGDALDLFPAGTKRLPWKRGSFRGFRAPGGILVGCRWRLPGRLRVELTNDGKTPVRLTLKLGGRDVRTVALGPGQSRTEEICSR